EPGMIDIPCCGHDEVAVGKLTRVISNSRFVIESRNSFASSFDRASERLVWEVRGIEEFTEKFVGRVLDHLHLFEDNFLLAFEVLLLKSRMRDQIRDQIDGLRKSVVRNLYREARHLMSRISVQVPAQPVSFNSNIPRGSELGAFENGVFDEVAD